MKTPAVSTFSNTQYSENISEEKDDQVTPISNQALNIRMKIHIPIKYANLRQI